MPRKSAPVSFQCFTHPVRRTSLGGLHAYVLFSKLPGKPLQKPEEKWRTFVICAVLTTALFIRV